MFYFVFSRNQKLQDLNNKLREQLTQTNGADPDKYVQYLIINDILWSTVVSALLAVRASGCVCMHIVIGNLSETTTLVGTQVSPQNAVYMANFFGRIINWLLEQPVIAHTHAQ